MHYEGKLILTSLLSSDRQKKIFELEVLKRLVYYVFDSQKVDQTKINVNLQMSFNVLVKSGPMNF